MRRQCEFVATRLPIGAWRQEPSGPQATEEEIDLDRVVWDPEYRDQVKESMRAAG